MKLFNYDERVFFFLEIEIFFKAMPKNWSKGKSKLQILRTAERELSILWLQRKDTIQQPGRIQNSRYCVDFVKNFVYSIADGGSNMGKKLSYPSISNYMRKQYFYRPIQRSGITLYSEWENCMLYFALWKFLGKWFMEVV